MNPRAVRRYIDDLLRGRRPKPFHPNDFEAAKLRAAIDLAAARPGSDAPREEFLSDLHHRLAAQLEDADASPHVAHATRRRVIVGTSAAAAAVAAGVAADRLLFRGNPTDRAHSGELVPNDGSWQAVASGADIADGAIHPFDLGSVVGFVGRIDGRVQAVSGVCTHQGCRLWFNRADDQLHCPCHSTSFSPTGQVLTHQLPIAPNPLPKYEVRERDGAIEVFAPKSAPTTPT